MPNAIVLIIDGLHAGYLGCYGNAWIGTPEFDTLASEAFVFDQALIDTPDLTRQYRSLWQGVHALVPDAGQIAPRESTALAERLRAAGVHTVLVTDEPVVAQHPLAAAFDQRVRLDPPTKAKSAKAIHKTWLAQAMAETIERLSAIDEPFLLWIHLRGLSGPWDAPLELREQFVEEDDPPPATVVEVPSLELPEDYDPDELLGLRRAYAGQVALVDTCLGAFHAALDERGLVEPCLSAVGSTRSFPLGEHRRVGLSGSRLHEELVHVPWVIHVPEAIAAAARSQALVQPADIWATLCDWWNLKIEETCGGGASLLPIMRADRDAVGDRACVVAPDGERAIRTPAWYLHMHADAEEESPPATRAQLFAKPDDRWEVNEVSARCPDIVEALREALAEYEAYVQGQSGSRLQPLDDHLMTEIR